MSLRLAGAIALGAFDAALAAFALALVITAPAPAAEVGQIPPDVPDNVRTWFKNLKSPGGGLCCDIADGHRTIAEQRSRTPEQAAAQLSDWWVMIEGAWRQMPQAAVITNAGNPVGEPVVWYAVNGDDALRAPAGRTGLQGRTGSVSPIARPTSDDRCGAPEMYPFHFNGAICART
jgi:hypothetical protein